MSMFGFFMDQVYISMFFGQVYSSVVVHGSEGMDITLCVTSIAQVILNPDCRTVRGFEALIEREWIQVITTLLQ